MDTPQSTTPESAAEAARSNVEELFPKQTGPQAATDAAPAADAAKGASGEAKGAAAPDATKATSATETAAEATEAEPKTEAGKSGASFVDRVKQGARNAYERGVQPDRAKANFSAENGNSIRFARGAGVGIGAVIAGKGVYDIVVPDQNKERHVLKGSGEIAAGLIGARLAALSGGKGASIG